MGKEKINLFGSWRTVYRDSKGEYLYTPSAGKKFGRKRGTKMYIKDIARILKK